MTSSHEAISAARVRPISVFSPAYRSITVSALLLLALAAFDGMAVAAALPRIGGDLGVTGLPWVLTSFALSSTVALLAAGPLIDSLGVRRTYRFTLVEFFCASLLCTLAPNLWLLVVARLLQGVGGGMVMAVTLANVGLTYPPELRSRAIAVNSMVWGTMALAGPAAAAFLLSIVSWRGIFFINLPLVVFAGVIGWNRLAEAGDRTSADFDVRGMLLVTALTVVLLLSLSTLRWASIVGLLVAAVLGRLYWRHSGLVDAPVVARRHLVGWPFGPMNLIPCMFFAGSLAVDAYLPIYVQGALARSSAQAAFAVAFLAVGWTTGSQVASRLLDRFENVDVMVGGFVLTLPGLMAGVVLYTDHAPLWMVYALSVVQGLGIGAVTNSTVSLLQSSAAPGEMGRVSGAHQFMRQFGGTLGTAAAGTVLLGVVAARIGSVEPVRRLLDGDDVEIAGRTRAAIAAGFRGAAMVALALNVVGGAIAVYTRRRFHGERAAGVGG